MIEVPQNLGPEQESYEFPSKARLQQLAVFYNDNDTDSFFDESSFTNTSTSSMTMYGDDQDDDDDDDDALESLYKRCQSPRRQDFEDDQLDRFFHSMSFKSSWEQEEDDEMEGVLADDGRLSPLQLPAQVTNPGNSIMHNHGSGVPRCTDQDEDDDYLRRICHQRRPREESCDSTATVTQAISRANTTAVATSNTTTTIVAPCSFLSDNHLGRVQEEEDDDYDDDDWYEQGMSSRKTGGMCSQGVTHSLHAEWLQRPRERFGSSSDDGSSNLPVYCSEAELIHPNDLQQHQHRYERRMDSNDSSLLTDDSRIVLVRLGTKKITVIERCSSTGTTRTDEGYDDRLDDEKENDGLGMLESTSTFLPLSEQEQEYLMHSDILRTAAAVKIQAAWRGYCHRKTMQQGKLQPAQRMMVDLVRLCGHVHRRQMTRVQERLEDVEMHLQEETAMRIAFEKAMEDMTILVDEQQQTLHERLEQEISVRQSYEEQIEATAAQIKPLEARLRQESHARDRLESMMSHVLEEMKELKSSRQREVEARRQLQAELDDARREIAILSKRSTTPTSRPPSSVAGNAIRTGLTVHAGTRSISSAAAAAARKSVAPSSATTIRSRTPAATPSPTTTTRRAISRMSTMRPSSTMSRRR